MAERGQGNGNGQRKNATPAASDDRESETRIRNAKPIQRSETLTSMRVNPPEPSAAQLHKEAHGHLAEVRFILNELTLTLDRLSRTRS